MSHLVVPKVECIESTDTFGRFVIEPLEKGFGVTLGNTLRRVLLGYLLGAAVTWVKIEDIQHEFTSIPNAKEDAIDFLLNVKGMRLKPITGRPSRLSLRVDGEKRVTAADIGTSGDFEIINPNLYLLTLDSPKARLNVEFNVEIGSGYKQAESGDNMPVEAIPVDAVFTPIRKVNLTVEPLHIGQETSHERLRLDVWTDGTISPTDAVSQGASLLVEQLSPFIRQTKFFAKTFSEDKAAALPIPEEQYNMPVHDLDLSVRTMNCLRRAGITTVGELIGKTEKELMSLRNFGQKSRREIDDRLGKLGLSLAAGSGKLSTETDEGETDETVEIDESATEEQE